MDNVIETIKECQRLLAVDFPSDGMTTREFADAMKNHSGWSFNQTDRFIAKAFNQGLIVRVGTKLVADRSGAMRPVAAYAFKLPKKK